MMERKRMAVLNRADTPAKKKKTPKKTVKPKADAKKYQVTRISPLDRPDEIDECCAVCFDGDSYDDNPILFCDKCNVAVHQLCYGIQKIPQGDWICKSCSSRGAAKRSSRFRICSDRFGAACSIMLRRRVFAALIILQYHCATHSESIKFCFVLFF